MSAEQRSLSAAVPRFDTVDLMRGYSILAVVLLHTWLRLYFAGYDLRQSVLPPMVSHLLFFNGGNGVTVFFAISGFLITLTSLRRFGSLNAVRVPTFYRIRFARIAPLLICVVAILVSLALAHVEGFRFTSKMAPMWRAILAVFTFHSNWLEARYGYLPPNWNVMWSLSVEEMFYLFFPLACFTLLRFRRGMLFFVVLLLSFVAMGPFARSVWSTNDVWLEQSYLGGMDSIALGCLTALPVDYLQRRADRFGLAAKRKLLVLLQVLGWSIVAVIACGPAWLWKLFPTKLDFYGTLLAGSACLIMFASVLRQTGDSTKRANPLTAPVRWYGRHSYEVYLTHEFVVVWGVLLFSRFHPNSHPGPKGLAQHQLGLSHMLVWVLGILILTAPLGWLVSEFISEPANRRLRGAESPRMPNV